MNQKYYDISVVVLTYNPNWKKLRATLRSIILQRNIHPQIIVSDDGSKNPLFKEVKFFFETVGFKGYKLIFGEKNEGTVCNFYRGISFADSDYIKVISPGDLLFDNNTLLEWLYFAKENNADISFCNTVFYNLKNNHVNIVKHKHHPRNVFIYLRNSSLETKLINYCILEDKIYGASILAKKKVLEYYLSFLLNRVVYAEDFFIRLAIFDKSSIHYYQRPGIWYEFADGGVSTLKEIAWKKKLDDESAEMDRITLDYITYKKIDEKYIIWLKEHYRYKQKWRGSSLLLKDKIKRYVLHPKWAYWKIYLTLFGIHSSVNVNNMFLNKCFEECEVVKY